MPIEIRELHIRVAVEAKPEPQQPSGQPAAAGNGGAGDKDAIVAECVEQILRIMRSKRER
jgi:hypothetical protein